MRGCPGKLAGEQLCGERCGYGIKALMYRAVDYKQYSVLFLVIIFQLVH
jgi:hypothetical protein